MRDWDGKRIRISLDLTPDEVAELDQLKRALKTRTRARLMRRALRFYAVLANLKGEGFLIQAIRKGELHQFPDLDVPYPQAVKPK